MKWKDEKGYQDSKRIRRQRLAEKTSHLAPLGGFVGMSDGPSEVLTCYHGKIGTKIVNIRYAT